MSLRFGNYQVNLDAIAARIIYRWRTPLLLVSIMLIVISFAPSLLFIVTERMRPVADLTLIAPDTMEVTVDGTPWPTEVRTGIRTIVGRSGDRVTRRDVALEPATPVTVSLRIGWAPLRLDAVALPQSAEAFRIYRDQDAIRVDYRIVAATESQGDASQPPATRIDPKMRRESMVFRAGIPERMVTSDAYNAWYDEANGQDERITVWARPESNRGEFRVTLSGEKSVTASATAVDAVIADGKRKQALFTSYSSGVSDIFVLKQNGLIEPVGAVRGTLTLRFWAHQSDVCVMAFLDRSDPQIAMRFSLVALVMEPNPSLVSIAEFNAAPGDIAPLAFVDGEKIFWGVSDAQVTRIFSTGFTDRRIREEAAIPGFVRGLGRDPETQELVVARLFNQQWDICRVLPDGLECIASISAPPDPRTAIIIDGSQSIPFIIGLRGDSAWTALPD